MNRHVLALSIAGFFALMLGDSLTNVVPLLCAYLWAGCAWAIFVCWWMAYVVSPGRDQ